MKKVTYIRCPRCELNYIQKKDKYCSVCKQEMQVGGGEVDELDLELCPICKTNYIQPDEVMCASCMSERSSNASADGDNNDWDAYVNRDDEDDAGDTIDDEVGDMASVKSLDDDEDDMVEDDDFDDLDMGDELEDEEKEEEFESEEDDFDDFDEEDDYDDDDEEDEEDDDE